VRELFLCEPESAPEIANDRCESIHVCMPSDTGGEQDECHGARPCTRWLRGRSAPWAAAKVAIRRLSVETAKVPPRV
jgi:hypothetical protein